MSKGRLFGRVADLYDDVRPDYPHQLYDVLSDTVGGLSGKAVLDLAAGTGLVSRALHARGAEVVATDVAAEMLSTLRRRTPAIPAVAAAAESLPFRPRTFDLVVCATAWHWLDAGAAVAEIRRTLRAGGHLALWWANHRHGDGIEWEDVQSAVFERWAVERGSRASEPAAVGPREAAGDLRDRGLDVVLETELTWERTVTLERHLQVLRTHSDNLVLGDRLDAFMSEMGIALQPWPQVVERLWGPLVVARVS